MELNLRLGHPIISVSHFHWKPTQFSGIAGMGAKELWLKQGLYSRGVNPLPACHLLCGSTTRTSEG